MKLLTGAIPLVAALLGVMPVYGAAPIVRSTVQDSPQTQASSSVVLPLEDRLQLMERRIQMLTDILVRLDRIQQEMQQLRGDVEMQGHTLESLKKRQRDLYGDIDRRLMQLTGKQPPAATPPSPYPVPAPVLGQTTAPETATEHIGTPLPATSSPQTTSADSVVDGGALAPTPSAAPQAAAQDAAAGAIPASPDTATSSTVKSITTAEVAPGVVVYSPDSSAAPTTVMATPVAPPADPTLEQPRYKQAFDLLMQRRYEEAKQAFRIFLQQYPNGRLAANAQYWVGEASYVTRDFATALDEFTKVVQVYPTSPKVSDSLLKIAFIQYEQKEWEKARETLETVIKQHATTTAARLARKRLERMRIEGN